MITSIAKGCPSCSKGVNKVAPQIEYSGGYQVVVLAVEANFWETKWASSA